jgi:hypothetical protein
MVQRPGDTLTLRAEDGAALLAQVPRSKVPRADAERGAWVSRMYVYGVCALQEAQRRAKRLRSFLCGTRPAPSPGASSAAGHAESGGPHAAAVCHVAAAGARATGPHAPRGAAQRPARAQPPGGHRPGTGCLGATAYAGATRVECPHAEWAVGQRGPVGGQGTRYARPAGGAGRVDGPALLSARRDA